MTEEFDPQGDAFDRFLAGDATAVPELESYSRALQSPSTAAELAHQQRVVSQMSQAAIVEQDSLLHRGRTLLDKLKSRAAVLSFVGTLLFGGAAYAATASGALDPILGTDSPAPADTSTTVANTTIVGTTPTTLGAATPTTNDSVPTSSDSSVPPSTTDETTETTVDASTTTTGAGESEDKDKEKDQESDEDSDSDDDRTTEHTNNKGGNGRNGASSGDDRTTEHTNNKGGNGNKGGKTDE